MSTNTGVASGGGDYALFLPYGQDRIRCLVRRRPARAGGSIAIHVEADGRVLADAPASASAAEVRAALMRRVAWIHRHRTDACRRREPLMAREYVSGETLHYLGRRYRLKLCSDQTMMGRAQDGISPRVRMRGGYIEVEAGDAPTPALVRGMLEAWYRGRAREVLSARMQAISVDLRWVKQAPPVTLRTMKRQWGSCSPQGRITLNVDLVRAPRDCIDYVILHELCHLRHHHHGKPFYRLLAAHLPQWPEVKRRLDAMAEIVLAR